MNRIIPVIFLLVPLNVFAERAQTSVAVPSRDKLTTCHMPGVDEEVLCGKYEVYENRTAREGRKLSLHIVVLPAKTTELEPDPLVFLAGGGVAPATMYAGFLSRAFTDLRLHRDILLIDQRGTGQSNPLECDLSYEYANPEFRDDRRFMDAVQRCRQQVEPKADLRFYTTPFAMDDLDEVRDWLGYPRINIYGVSYGTQAAMVYLRQHPEHVRSVTLQGVVPFDSPMWLEIPVSAQKTLDRVFATCAGQESCHNAFPKISEEFRALLKRLDEKSVQVKVTVPESKEEKEVPIDGIILRGFVAGVLFSAGRIHDLPLLIHLAYEGNYQPLALKLASRREDRSIPKGIYLSIVCNEEIPQFHETDVQRGTAGTFTGAFRVNRDVIACKQWPKGWIPKDYWTPVRSSVPALIMTGALDHVTPPRYGERVSRSFSNSRNLVLPNRGHNDVDPCVTGIISTFIIAGNAKALDTSCLAKSEELTFALKEEDLADSK